MTELTLDALAAATQVPSRTIRYYQAQGLLPPPTLKGRVAYYGAGHVERLRLVADLKGRGLQIKAIATVLARVDKGELPVTDWLGLDAQLDEAWAEDAPRELDRAGLDALAGRLSPARLRELLSLGLVERKGARYLVPRPAQLKLALRMAALGVELVVVVTAARLLRARFAKTAHELASQFLPGRRGGLPPTAVMREVRPIALEAVRLLFAHEMERVLRERGPTRG
jgi:DNA-binding transcriptional MerR regulator